MRRHVLPGLRTRRCARNVRHLASQHYRSGDPRSSIRPDRVVSCVIVTVVQRSLQDLRRPFHEVKELRFNKYSCAFLLAQLCMLNHLLRPFLWKVPHTSNFLLYLSVQLFGLRLKLAFSSCLLCRALGFSVPMRLDGKVLIGWRRQVIILLKSYGLNLFVVSDALLQISLVRRAHRLR